MISATSATTIGYAYVAQLAPPMPMKFYGSVIIRYQAGRVILVEVTEQIRPV